MSAEVVDATSQPPRVLVVDDDRGTRMIDGDAFVRWEEDGVFMPPLEFKTITSMARVLGIGVVAEGVETLFQEEFVRDNCGDREAQGQGYLFSRPVPHEAFERLLFPG